MRSALLRGRDNPALGAIAAVAEGPAALALSRGGAAKPYPHKEPNEDVAGFVQGPGGTLLAVADGHAGHEAAELAVERLFAGHAARWTAARAPAGPWEARALGAVNDAWREVVAASARGGNPDARTTLCFALLRPGEGQLAWASLGDSHVFRLDGSTASELSPAREPILYLGSPSRGPEEVAAALRLGSGPAGGLDALFLATDGLSERGIGVAEPRRAVEEAAARAREAAPARRALEAARGLLELALAAHVRQRAGDNAAAALLWLR